MINLNPGKEPFDRSQRGAAPDPDGSIALSKGARFYEKGMSITSPDKREERIACFQTAEELFLRAVEYGNAYASLYLGYLYSYDRCEGSYLQNKLDNDGSFPREARAYESFLIAANAGLCEGCYKLGDMYRYGIGCTQDAENAFNWYMKAMRNPQQLYSPVLAGSIMLRLGECYEDALGCEKNLLFATVMYKNAVEQLEKAVDAGDSWYEKALAHARAGAKRCNQETDLYLLGH